jgi:hypothetical protein
VSPPPTAHEPLSLHGSEARSTFRFRIEHHSLHHGRVWLYLSECQSSILSC